MTEKEFNLSDKILIGKRYKYINLTNVKKAVRRLNKYIKFRRNQMSLDYCMVYTDILMQIDKIFGDKLVD